MCGSQCQTPTPSQAHCSECHVTFGGVSGFDKHRKSGSCVGPEKLGFVKKKGVWKYPPNESLAGYLASIKQ